MSYLFATPRSAGPVALASNLWQAAQLALKSSLPFTASPPAAGAAAGVAATSVAGAAVAGAASWANEVKKIVKSLLISSLWFP